MARIREILLPWDGQPQGYAPIDRSSDFTVGLNSAYSAQSGSITDLTGRYTNAVTGTLPAIAAGAVGIGMAFNGSSNYVSTQAEALSYGTTFSRVAVVIRNSLTATQAISSTTVFNGATLRFNGANLSFVRSGVAEVFNLACGVGVGEIAVVGMTYDGATARAFANGRELGSAAYAYSFLASFDASLGRRGNSTELFDGQIVLHLDYGVAVPREVMRELTQIGNIWRIHKPQTIYIPVSAGGGTPTLLPSGISSLEAFGTASISVGPISVLVSGISSSEAFGTHVLSNGSIIIVPSGIASLEAFGTAILDRGTVIVSPSGISTAEAFGTASALVGTLVIYPNGISSAELFGIPAITGGTPSLITSVFYVRGFSSFGNRRNY
jgi:hypothetical protein